MAARKFCALFWTFWHYEAVTVCCLCDDVLQKANVPKFEVEGHLDSTTCCVTQPFTGEVGQCLSSCVLNNNGLQFVNGYCLKSARSLSVSWTTTQCSLLLVPPAFNLSQQHTLQKVTPEIGTILDTRFWSVCHNIWCQIFTGAGFWSRIEHCSISVSETGTNGLLQLADGFIYIQCFQCLGFFNLRIDLGFKGNCNAAWEF